MSRANGKVSEPIAKFLYQETASNDEMAGIRDQLDIRTTRVFDYSSFNMADLPAFKGKLADAANGTPTRATMLCIGDSVSFDIPSYLYQRLWLAYGFGGITSHTMPEIFAVLPSNGATYTSQGNVDYTVSPNSMHYTLPSAGVITWQFTNSYTGACTFPATEFKIRYKKAPTSGTFKVQYFSLAGAWTDVAGYTAIDTSGTAGFGVATVPVPEGVRQYSWRVVGVSGTTTIQNLGIQNPSGVNIINVTQGGTDIATAMATCPSYMVAGLLADTAPDFMLLAGKDDAGPLAGGLTAWQAYLDAQNPVMDAIYCGVYGGTGDGGVNYASNAVVQAHAKNSGKIFYDYFVPGAVMEDLGFMLIEPPTNTHSNERFKRFIAQRFMADFALCNGPLGGLPFDTDNVITRSRRVDARDNLAGSMAEVSSLRVGGNGARATLQVASGVITSATVTARGRSYVSPVATITGVGSGATATVQSTGGEVTGVTITNGGTGYTTAVITITDSAAAVFDNATATGPSRVVITGTFNLNCASGTALTITGSGSNVANLRLVSAATNPVPITIWDNDNTTLRMTIARNAITNAVGNFDLGTGASTAIRLRVGGVDVAFVQDTALAMQDAKNISFSQTTGSKIGTNSAQKIGFWNATPVVQQVLATGTLKTVDDVITLLQTLGLCRQS